MKTLDDIRALIDPEGYVRALGEAKTTLEGRLPVLFVDYDMTASTPELTEEQRAPILAAQERNIRDLHWRIGEIDRRIEAAADGAMNRTDRRRKNGRK